ncbi:unnamed protein product, partial [Brassica oleracea var. botrytis]
VWFVILGGFHQEDLRSNRGTRYNIANIFSGTMIAVELLKNHVLLLTWSCKQPLKGVQNFLDQISSVTNDLNQLMPKKPKDFKWLIDVGEAAWEYFTRERQTPTPPPQTTPPPQPTLPKTSPPTPPIRLFDGTGKERLKIPPHFPSTFDESLVRQVIVVLPLKYSKASDV